MFTYICLFIVFAAKIFGEMVALIDPISSYGLGYLKALERKNVSFVVIKDIDAHVSYPNMKGVISARISDPSDVIRAIEKSPYRWWLKGVISGFDHGTLTASKVSEHFGWRSAPYNAALAAKRKDIARDLYQAKGIPSPKYKKVLSLYHALHEAQIIGYPIVVKPVDSLGSIGVKCVHNDMELTKAFEENLNLKPYRHGFSREPSFLLEEYIDGLAFCATVFLNEGKLLAAAVAETTSTNFPYFCNIGYVTPPIHGKEAEQSLIEVSYQAAIALGFTHGVYNIDLKLKDGKPVVLETNGRPAGDQISEIVLEATGLDVWEADVACILGQTPDLRPSRNLSAAVAFLTADRKGIVSKIEGFAECKNSPGVIDMHFFLVPGKKVDLPKSVEDRYGYVVCVDSQPEIAKQKAFNAIQKIKIHYKNE